MKKVQASKHKIDDKKVLKCIFSAIDASNKTSAPKHRLQKAPEAVLYGKNGRLDSLGLVNLIVAVEERVSREFGAELVLADSRAMSQKNSPFRTVQTLVDYVSLLLRESGGK
jgi:acyl carrier protein